MTPRAALDFRNVNALWASVAVETLARVGVRHAVISPGSRSTPLTIQFARHPQIEAVPVLDERSAAFFALGLARRGNGPVVLLCTSGTAGANYFPAVIEARESGVPLLVITADRPPEMRGCRSGQTIDQQKLFGSYVNHYHELAVPEATVAMLRYLRQTVAYAAGRALWPTSGPVHLNAPFRDPLPPIRGEIDLSAIESTLAKVDLFSELRPPSIAAPGAVRQTVRLPARGVIVAGQTRPSDPAAYARAVGNLARRLGWPVLADALSPLRNHRRFVPGLVTSYDVLLRSAALAKELAPEHVLCLHDWPTSKVLRQWLAGDAFSTGGRRGVTFLGASLDNPDALHLATNVVREDVGAFAARARPVRISRDWLKRWVALDAAAIRRLKRGVAGSHPAFEGRVASLLPQALRRDSTVMVANSMPVRDLEYFWPANDQGHVVHCNRGANGIDGTLSTALGLAHRGKPTFLLTGDLAFLHDSNGLLIAPKFRGSLTVILVNNDGGGIFQHLPVAQFDPPFEEFFATPQKVDFAKLCEAHGVKHRVLRNEADLRAALKQNTTGIRVLEWRCDRAQDSAFRREFFARLAESR